MKRWQGLIARAKMMVTLDHERSSLGGRWGGVGASLKELRQPASASERPRQMETFQKPRFSGPHHHRAGGDHDHGDDGGDHGDGGGGHESKHGVGLEHGLCIQFNPKMGFVL